MDLCTYGNKVLEIPAGEVKDFSNLTDIIDHMFYMMVKHDGVGLAAPQIGLPLRLFVFDNRDGLRGHFINPTIMCSTKKTLLHEGCLSFPGLYLDDVRRSNTAIVSGLNVDGKFLSYTTHGFTAQIMQHEVDHLNGQLFINRSVGQSDHLIEDWKRSL